MPVPQSSFPGPWLGCLLVCAGSCCLLADLVRAADEAVQGRDVLVPLPLDPVSDAPASVTNPSRTATPPHTRQSGPTIAPLSRENAALITLSMESPESAGRGRMLLSIDMQGRVRAAAPDGTRTIDAPSLTALELKLLWREIAIDEQLVKCSTRVLQQELAAAELATGLPAAAAGASDTIITLHPPRPRSTGPVDLGPASIVLRIPALDVMARRYPEAPWIQRVARAERRLRNELAVAQVGGRDQAASLAQTASTSLQNENPDAAPLRIDELTVVRELRSGERFCQFTRNLTSDSGSGTLIVSVFELPAAPPRVTVLSGLPTLR